MYQSTFEVSCTTSFRQDFNLQRLSLYKGAMLLYAFQRSGLGGRGFGYGGVCVIFGIWKWGERCGGRDENQ